MTSALPTSLRRPFSPPRLSLEASLVAVTLISGGVYHGGGGDPHGHGHGNPGHGHGPGGDKGHGHGGDDGHKGGKGKGH
jgi:hypothetical protein